MFCEQNSLITSNSGELQEYPKAFKRLTISAIACASLVSKRCNRLLERFAARSICLTDWKRILAARVLVEWQGQQYLKLDWVWSHYPAEANARIDFMASFSELLTICAGIYILTCLAFHKRLLAAKERSTSQLTGAPPTQWMKLYQKPANLFRCPLTTTLCFYLISI